jgi:hydroxybutyrate-dimer hydrolase
VTQQIAATVVGEPRRYAVDGASDDLLTAGLGAEGLRDLPPAFADPERPTPRELRRRAVHAAYRGLVDVSVAGGFGRLYGPTSGRGIAGVEYLVQLRTPDGRGVTTVLVQIPSDFDAGDPGLLAVASSGSRGIYGALPTAADWGLRRGYAVVHTDKGTGVGVWDLDRGRGYRIDGTLTDDPGDPLLTFAPAGSAELAAYARREPHTLLFKHAQSGLNPEADWGDYLLQAISVGFELLNHELGDRLRRRLAPGNTLVLAAGVSNGGGAVLRALERDRAGWISGALACEPNAMVSGRTAGLEIHYDGRRLKDAGIALYDYSSLHYLYQPCAVLAESDAAAPLYAATAANRPRLEARCAGMQELGLLPAGPPAAAATAAREQLLEAGMLPESLRLGHFNLASHLWSALTVSYAWAYARRPPWEPYAGASFAARDADGRPRALTEAEAASLWADSNGIAPTGPISVCARDAAGERRANDEGSLELALAYAPDRVLARAPQPVAGLPPDRAALLAAVRRGQDEVVMSGRLGNRPVIIVHGRADSLIPVNHASRAYYAVNQRDRGARDELRYYELEHGHHFDGYLALPGLAEGYVPMQVWLCRGLDALLERLRTGTPLPPSQVIRSRPRGGAGAAVPPLAEAHVGRLRADPGDDAIRYADGVLTVPD